MSSEKRKYELRKRAERQADTRRRIAEATVELHQEVGPARTTVAEIARRAGVQRLTVYNNFPEERTLFEACQRHWLSQHPPPDFADAVGRGPLGERVEGVLRDLYRWYGRTERMATNIRRDRELLPALDALMTETSDARLRALAEALTASADARGRRKRELQAVLAVALAVWTWRRLTREGLDDAAAARLMTQAVEAVAGVVVRAASAA
jgi:AcrR family transcriptional regulator